MMFVFEIGQIWSVRPTIKLPMVLHGGQTVFETFVPRKRGHHRLSYSEKSRLIIQRRTTHVF